MIIKPNWTNPFRVTYEFSTEIITSRKGREQRIAQRITPRKSFDYKVMVHNTKHRELHRALAAQQHELMTLPEFTRKVRSTVGVSSGGYLITVQPAAWIKPGQAIFIEDDLNTVVSVTASSGALLVELDQPSLQDRVAGFRVFYAVQGYMQASQAVSQATSTAAQMDFKFNVLPGSEDLTDLPAATTMFNGREVLTKKPNWVSPPSFTYSRDVEDLDYGRGRIDRFNPVPFGTTMVALQFLARTPQQVDEIVNMQARLLGRQGEFHMSTGLPDITLLNDSAPGTYTIIVPGAEFASQFADDTVHQAVCVRMRDGSVIYNKLVSLVAVSTSSVMTFESPWPAALNLNSVSMISWLPVWRMASDSLTIEWATDEVAQYKINVQTLEDLPV